MKKSFLILSFLTLSTAAQAKIEALFHPTDPTLPKAAEWIRQADHTIDIAMYNMETGSGSPVIQAFKDPKVQQRLKDGSLSVRIVFEGYGTPAENEQKMAELEAIGLDARALTSGKHVHHKFAVIDGDLESHSRVITGSANWSLTSYKSYDENMIFVEDENETTAQYGQEFELLWNNSKDFGRSINHPKRTFAYTGAFKKDEIDAYFNSPRHLKKDKSPDHVITTQIVRLIDSARSSLSIATTRVRLEPVLDALKGAADRGVKIRLLISQDDFHDLSQRSKWLFGNKNLELRIKFYSLRPGDYLTYQMHNKWMIVDGKTVWSGSFNWSESSENLHIENALEMSGRKALEILPTYEAKFDEIWDRGRNRLPGFETELKKAKDQKSIPTCAFQPISVSYDEVRYLLALAPKCK